MGKIKRPFRFGIMIFIIFCISLWGIYKTVDMAKRFLGYGNISFNKTASIDYDEKKNFFISPFQGGIVVYEGTTLKGIAFNGEEKWSIEGNIKNPILRSSKELVFLGDGDHGKIDALDGEGKIIWSYDLKKNIRDFVANENGDIALYSEDEDQRGEIYIIGSKGEEKGRIPLSKGTLINLAISDSDPMIAISVMDIENNKIETKVILYSLQGKLLGGNKYDNEIVYNIFFSKDGQLLSIGDTKLIAFSKEKGPLWTKDIQSPTSKIAWNQQGFIVMNLLNNKSVIDTKNINNMSIVDMKGMELGNTSVKGEVLGIDTQGNNILVFTDRTLYLFSKEGEELGEKKINHDIQGVYLISYDKIALILKNRVDMITVKYKGK